MCFGSSAPVAPPPPPPAPPPDVLTQDAPQTNAKTQSDQIAEQAEGTKKYRTGTLNIASADSGANSNGGGSGLGIPTSS